MATDASTSNFIVLPTGVISKTGTCAQMADGNMADIKARRIGNLIEASLEDKRHANLWRTFYFTQWLIGSDKFLNRGLTLSASHFVGNSACVDWRWTLPEVTVRSRRAI
jgi:hypothetical protein